MSVSKKQLFARYAAKMKSLLSSSQAEGIYDGLRKGKHSILRFSRYESSAFDTSWIDIVEDCIIDLGDIINAPRMITKEEGSLVPVELAKKTNGESVQHLASHTQYIKSIDEKGKVIPSKIMSFTNDDFLYTYENRFIATFIRQLVLFVEKRYEFIQAFIPLHKEEVLHLKHKSVINGEEIEIETKIKVKAEVEDADADAAKQAAERIYAIREYVLYYYASPFMKKMKTEKNVRKPIHMTNILRKNPAYHKCYEAFMFLDKYESLGMDYKSEDKYLDYDEEMLDELTYLLYADYLTLKDDDQFDVIKTRAKAYKPKILSSIDDEEFLYGPVSSNPVAFVRVDEDYQRYLDGKVRKDLPLHPKKAEKGFFAEEYEEKRENRQDLSEKEKLLRRKARAALRFEKAVEQIIAEREAEEAMLAKMEEEERLEHEELLLQKKREEVVESAELDGLDVTDEPEPDIPEENIDEIFIESDLPQTPVEPVEVSEGEKEEAPSEEVSPADEAPAAEEGYEVVLSENEAPEEEPAYEEETALPAEEPFSEDVVLSKEEEPVLAIEEPEAPIEEPQEEVEILIEEEAPREEVAPQDEPATVFEMIPGRFIVKCPEGYYVRDGFYSKNKSEAYVFIDFNRALEKKKMFGGKVVKL